MDGVSELWLSPGMWTKERVFIGAQSVDLMPPVQVASGFACVRFPEYLEDLSKAIGILSNRNCHLRAENAAAIVHKHDNAKNRRAQTFYCRQTRTPHQKIWKGPSQRSASLNDLPDVDENAWGA